MKKFLFVSFIHTRFLSIVVLEPLPLPLQRGGGLRPLRLHPRGGLSPGGLGAGAGGLLLPGELGLKLPNNKVFLLLWEEKSNC